MNQQPQTYLAFLHNTLTREDFIAPAVGENSQAATANLRESYPSAVYTLQTMYPAEDMRRYLSDLQRWPSLPSRIQPKLADLMATQRIRTQVGGLPPLHKPAPAAQPVAGLSASQLNQLKLIAKGMPAETQALAARLLAGGLQAEAAQAPTAPAVARMPLATPQQMAPAAASVVAAIVTPRLQPQPMQPSPMAQQPITRAPLTLHQALKALRAQGGEGVGGTIEQTATPAPRMSPAMYPSQPKVVAAGLAAGLPASARGVGQPAASDEKPVAFAVGNVSAISVLKALRGRG